MANKGHKASKNKFCCIINILNKNCPDDLQEINLNQFKFSYNQNEKRYECLRNFDTKNKAQEVVDLFNNKEFNGYQFEAFIEHCCIIDIKSDTKNAVNTLETYIKRVLSENQLKCYQKNMSKKQSFIYYNESKKQYECFINFNSKEIADRAVELFNNHEFVVYTFKAKYQDPNKLPENWIDCENQATSLIDGEYLKDWIIFKQKNKRNFFYNVLSIDRFLAFKVPLKEDFIVPDEKKFDISMLSKFDVN